MPVLDFKSSWRLPYRKAISIKFIDTVDPIINAFTKDTGYPYKATRANNTYNTVATGRENETIFLNSQRPIRPNKPNKIAVEL